MVRRLDKAPALGSHALSSLRTYWVGTITPSVLAFYLAYVPIGHGLRNLCH